MWTRITVAASPGMVCIREPFGARPSGLIPRRLQKQFVRAPKTARSAFCDVGDLPAFRLLGIRGDLGPCCCRRCGVSRRKSKFLENPAKRTSLLTSVTITWLIAANCFCSFRFCLVWERRSPPAYQWTSWPTTTGGLVSGWLSASRCHLIGYRSRIQTTAQFNFP